MGYYGIYTATSVEDINKFRPGKCKFAIPALMDSDGVDSPATTKITNNTSNIANKDKSNLDVSCTEISNYVDIEVPLEHTIYYPVKIIPKGTIFWIMFVGGDINKPIIVGRDINGYYS